MLYPRILPASRRGALIAGLLAAALLAAVPPPALADHGGPHVTMAEADAHWPANTMVVTYDMPVACDGSAQAARQFTYRDADPAVAAAAIACASPRPDQVALTFPRGTFTDGDDGTVFYAPASTPAARVADADGRGAASSSTRVDSEDRTAPSIEYARAVAGDLLRVEFSESVTCRESAAAAAQFSVVMDDGTTRTGQSIECDSPEVPPSGVRVFFRHKTFAPGVNGQVTYTPDAGSRRPRIRDHASPVNRARAETTAVLRLRLVRFAGDDPVVIEGTGRGNGATAVLTVRRAGNPEQTVTVAYRTRNGRAKAGKDYTRTSGVLTFVPGDEEETIRVPVTPDRTDERRERFKVVLSDATEATLGDELAVVSIRDDDRAPRIQVLDAQRREGGGGEQSNLRFAVRLSRASGKNVRFSYMTAQRSGSDAATAGSDYRTASGSAVIRAGSRSATIRVRVFGDVRPERDERFKVRLHDVRNARSRRSDRIATGTIVDDD